MTIAFLYALLLSLFLVSYNCDDDIGKSESFQEWMALATGFLLETLDFLYTCMLPLKVAKDVTEQKLKSMFSKQLLDPRTHSFVGTIVGAMIGATYINDTVAFANINFLVLRLLDDPPSSFLWTVIVIMLLAPICLYKELWKELLQIGWVRRLFPKKIKSYTVSHIEY